MKVFVEISGKWIRAEKVRTNRFVLATNVYLGHSRVHVSEYKMKYCFEIAILYTRTNCKIVRFIGREKVLK
jgi:hypothetical protein